MGHREAELVDGNGEVRDHKEHGAQAGGQLGPGPQVHTIAIATADRSQARVVTSLIE